MELFGTNSIMKHKPYNCRMDWVTERQNYTKTFKCEFKWMVSYFLGMKSLQNPKYLKLYLKPSYNRDHWSFIGKITEGKSTTTIPWIKAVEQTHLMFPNAFAYVSTDNTIWTHGLISQHPLTSSYCAIYSTF